MSSTSQLSCDSCGTLVVYGYVSVDYMTLSSYLFSTLLFNLIRQISYLIYYLNMLAYLIIITFMLA